MNRKNRIPSRGRLVATATLLLLLAATMPAGEAPKKGTVVTIHGFMRGGGCMWKMKRAFRKGGWRTVNYKYKTRKHTIPEHGDMLVTRLKEIARKHPGEPIHFVTHSMGGLVLRSALNNPDVPVEALKGCAVLIAPPNKGSELARKLGRSSLVRWVFGNKSGKELYESSEYSVSRLGEFPLSTPVLVIAGTSGHNPFIKGKDDGKVACWETRLRTEHEYRQVKSGHALISWSRKAINPAKEFVERDRSLPRYLPLAASHSPDETASTTISSRD